jgi:hypothetical protein
MMVLSSTFFGVFLLHQSFLLVYGAPVASVGSANANPPLHGDESLLGYSSSNPVSTKNTDNIPFTPVPGQTANSLDGFYLAFEDEDSPQPIRGTKGATDPGPRTSSLVSKKKSPLVFGILIMNILRQYCL